MMRSSIACSRRVPVCSGSRAPLLTKGLMALAALAWMASACDGSRPATNDGGTHGSGGAGSGGAGSGGAGSGGAGSGGSTGGGGRGASSGGASGGGSTGATGGVSGSGGRGSGGVGSGGTGGGGHGNGTGGANGGGGGGIGSGGVGPVDAGSDDTGTSGCTYGGTIHAVGTSFPATDGCNTCTCGAGGVVGCTKIGCIDSGATCTLETSYRFSDDGGLRAYADLSKLTPARTHTVSRDHFMNALPDSCMREVPCSSTTEVDIAKIQNALAHADVVAALGMKTKPFYGTDTRPADSTVFVFERADGRGFTLGSGNGVPAGLRALAELLHTLQMQTLGTAACANLR